MRYPDTNFHSGAHWMVYALEKSMPDRSITKLVETSIPANEDEVLSDLEKRVDEACRVFGRYPRAAHR